MSMERQRPGVFHHTAYHGLYERVARLTGCDRSYVSRVAKGERHSRTVEVALQQEMDRMDAKSGRQSNGKPGKSPRLRRFLKENLSQLQSDWLTQCQADHELSGFRMAPAQRTRPIGRVISETLLLMRLAPSEIGVAQRPAAMGHGQLRRQQGYTIGAMIEEYNLVRRCFFAMAIKYAPALNPALLLHDLSQVGEVLDRQIQAAAYAYLNGH